ncbi:hypothetical protein Ade02nite_32970 [Paractinoplanes deccanensis]|uniref:Carrier domain-containing protein n=1 Tax=Paractinoplanes deccanensis TaxID=113561 RepID=A0ABQ3Y3U3_9ACTN|nr:non-ribosomal peptide synthetase [Actinoplanes deccanensis]GID74656.1 hypothetical protein Ade02nite_32970 [Actinoplanes deccanensis]
MTTPGGLQDILPLSPLQEGLYFLSTYAADGPDVYVVQQVLTLDGALDTARLRAAAQAVQDRHANLRAAFRPRKAGQPVQLIPAALPVDFTVVDLSDRPAGDARTDPSAPVADASLGGRVADAGLGGRVPDVDEVTEAERRRPFDLARPPLLRWTLIRLGDERHRLVLTAHHILLDGWSAPLLVRDLLTIYAGAEPPAARPYKDYLAWVARQDRDAAERAWRSALSGVEEATLIAPGAERAAAEPEAIERQVDVVRVAEVARERGLTLNTVMQGAYALVLAEFTGRDDLVFGATVSGRPGGLAGVENMVGLFINTVPVRIRPRPADTWAGYLARVQAEQAALLDHQHIGLATIQRQTGVGALFDTLLVFESYPLDEEGLRTLQDAAGLRLAAVTGTDATHYPLTLTVVPGPKEIALGAEYRPDVVSRSAAERVLDRLADLLAAFAAEPDGRLAAIKPAGELVTMNTSMQVPPALLLDVFDAQVRKTPDAVALRFGGAALSYAELHARVDRLARLLVARGAGPEKVVAVLVPRTEDAVVAWLAALRSGGIYLPIDVDYPRERIDYLLADAAPAVIVTPQVLAEATTHPNADTNPAGVAVASLPVITPQNGAYLIYTSGSTGRPKGVVVEHASLANLFHHHRLRLIEPMNKPIRAALSAALVFDTSWEGLLWLVAGHELHLLDDETRRDADLFVDYVRRHRIDALDVAPSLGQELVHAGLLSGEHAPALVMLGGEAAGPALWSALREAPRTIGVNLYGPTECTVDTLMAHVPDSAAPLVGRPIGNTRAYVLDGWLRPVAPGVAGELYLAGAQLGRGYKDRAGLTATRFVADPWAPGERMYRTGDVVRWTGDDRLEFVGRADDQVKIRGFRVEPGEVAAVLAEHPAVAQAVVVPRDGRLVAYIVGSAGESPGQVPEGLREWAAGRLPGHLLPAAFVGLDRLPVTVAGKVDKRALPAPDFGVLAGGEAPRTPAEETLAKLFAEVLGLPAVGVEDSFFTLGGDSIVSLQLVARARTAGLRITPRQIFELRTVAALAAVAAPAEAPRAVAAEAALGEVPLTPMLAWLRDNGPATRYSQSMVLRAPAGLTAARLEAVVQALLDRHDLLRARWNQATGLTVPPPGSLAAATVIGADRLRPEEGVPLRVTWTPGQVEIVVHHTVVDGVSWRILLADIAGAWADVLAGRPIALPPVGTSFREWARGLAPDDAELPYWRSVLDVSEPVLGARPVDPARDTVATARTVTVELDASLIEPIPAAFHTGVTEVLLAGLAVAMGGRDVLVELEGHGRDTTEADLSRTVGWFTTEFPVRLSPGGTDPAAALKRVKEQLRAVPGNGAGYGLLRPRLTGLPEPQILVNYLGRFTAGGGSGDEDWAPLGGLDGDADPEMPLRRALEINASIVDGRLTAALTYPDGVLTEDEVRRLGDAWFGALVSLAGARGGRTASDLLLPGVQQEEIDALERRPEGLEDIWPLSPLQEGLVFLAALADTVDPYVVQQVLDLSGPLDPGRMRAAGQALLDRHPALRASFAAGPDGQLRQVVAARAELPWAELALSEREFEDFAAEDRARPFDLAQAPLLRLTLVRLEDGRHRLVLTNHHVLLDGWSTPLAVRELFDLYAGRTLPAPRPYRDYLRWLTATDRAAAETAWRASLDGLDQPTLVAPGAGAVLGARPGKLERDLPREVTDRLTALARQRQVTLNTVVQAAWAVLLVQLTGRTDVVFGTTVSGRPAQVAGVDEMIGFFINTLPVRVPLDPRESWAALLDRLQSGQSALLEHQHLPLTDVQRLAGLGELFDTLTIFESYPLDTDGLHDATGSAGLRMTDVTGDDAPHYPLTLAVAPGERLRLGLAYRSDVFTDAAASEILDRYGALLADLAAEPGKPVGRALPERAAVEPVAVPDTTLPRLFADAVRATPDEVAVVFEGDQLTYAELDARVAALAGRLRERGAGPETVVALALPRSLDLVVALHAVHRAGAAYLPIDPTHPRERNELLLADSGATLLLTPENVTETGEPVRETPALHGACAAYVIYTSGSTGRPKGATISHRSIVNRLLWMRDRYRLRPGERVLQKTPAGFDVSVWEFFWPLLTGATLVVARPDGHRDPAYLADVMARNEVTTVHFVPSMLRAFLADSPRVPSLRRVVCSGEALPGDLARRFGQVLPGVELHNLYGPTEAAVDVTHHPVDTSADGPVPIGRPVWNTEIHVLDPWMRPVPPGVTGELYLGGVQLARGYLGRPALTAQRFVANPFGDPGSRLYRTGDLARFTESGDLDYAGRTDDQVKIRGLRVEPGEIEAALTALPGVTAAAVVARDDGPARRLVAYVVGEPPADLPAALAATLPEHLVPAAFVRLPELPLSPNGKLDRRRLPAPDFASHTGGDEPRTPTEEVFAALVAGVLGLDRVGVRDSFFTLGGDSILALQLTARARAAGWRLAARDVFARPTVEGMASVAAPLELSAANPADAFGDVPPTPFMRGLDDPADPRLTQSMVVRVPAGLTPAALTERLQKLIDHHDMLRARWTGTALHVPPPGTVAFALDQGLAPAEGRMVSASMPDGDRLRITVHHLAVDAVSWPILLADLASEGPLPPVGTSFRSWALALEAATRDEERAHWESVFTGPPAYLTDVELDPATDTLGTLDQVTARVPAGRLTTAIPAAYRADVQDVLLATLTTAAGRDVLVELEGHGREERLLPGADLSRTVGWFTTAHPVRLSAPDSEPAAALKRVKEQLRAAPDRGLGYGLQRRTDPRPPILFNYLGRAEQSNTEPSPWQPVEGLRGDASDHLPARHVLSVEATVEGDEIVLSVAFPRRAMPEKSVRALLTAWSTALASLNEAPGDGGLTPSDVLARVDQEALDELATRCPGLTDVLPLTPLQEGLFYLHALDGAGDVYTVQQQLDLDGPLDAARLHRAAQSLLDRHPNLRAAFTTTANGAPVQVIPAHVEVPWRETAAAIPSEADHLADAERNAPFVVDGDGRVGVFDLGTAPLVKFLLIRVGDGRHRLVITQHHVIVDGWSGPLIARELLSAYSGRVPAVGRAYRDFLAWLQQADAEAAREAWRAALAGVTEPTLVAPGTVGRSARLPGEVIGQLPSSFVDFAREQGVTPNTLVQALWAVLLGRLTGRDDVVFGATVSGRPPELAGADETIGLFINTVPVRARLLPGESWQAFLGRLQQEQAGLLAHQHLGLAPIQQLAGVGELFDTLVVFESYPVDDDRLDESQRDAGLKLAGVIGRDATHYPLTLAAAVDEGEGLHLALEYRPDVFDAQTARLLLDRLVALAAEAVANPGQAVDRADALTAEERRRVLTEWNGAALPVTPRTLPGLVRDWARKTPDATALVVGERRWTYASLMADVDSLAATLVDAGAGPGRIVALLLPRGEHIVPAIFGAMASGAAYLPIDPEYPPARIAAMLDDARPVTTLAVRSTSGLLPGGAPRLVLDGPYEQGTGTPQEITPDHPAYVIYTSGSTGRPKGVLVPHRTVANLLASHTARILGPAAAQRGRALRVAHNWSFAFDASWQPLLALLGGNELHLVTDEPRRDPQLLAELLRDNGIDMIEVAPSHLDQLLAAGFDAGGLAVLGVGGEAVPDQLWTAMAALPQTESYNFYGPTECTVDTIVQRVKEVPRALIGRPVANTTLYVLDGRLRPVPPGVAGELYIGGAQLALGYLHQPGLSSARFVADPFAAAPGSRMYRTGDVVRWTADGRIDYLGRSDDQVKIRGYRIELGEVATVLSQHPSVTQAVVVADAGRLIAYVVGGSADLRAWASERLPAYLVPAAVVELDALPLTVNGKLDRAALPRVEYVSATREPQGEQEERLAALFTEVLGVPVGAEDSFFDLGGDSIAAMRLTSLARAHGVPLRLSDLVALKTVAALAEVAA